jgi:hypothetical protein
MTPDSSGTTNGIAWTGATADASAGSGSPGIFNYLTIYSGTPGTGADANHLTNTGISSSPTITISATVGSTYSIDLLFANAFGPRTFDVSVEGTLFLDNLALDLTDNRRPLVYRFELVAADSQIQIVLTPGAEPGYADTNPYVNAMMVTQVVPEPSTLVFGALGMIGLLRRRRR